MTRSRGSRSGEPKAWSCSTWIPRSGFFLQFPQGGGFQRFVDLDKAAQRPTPARIAEARSMSNTCGAMAQEAKDGAVDRHGGVG
ncbi:MAG: hypothetical protein R3F11_17820 [Verrucomicrobiales bacterium]